MKLAMMVVFAALAAILVVLCVSPTQYSGRGLGVQSNLDIQESGPLIESVSQSSGRNGVDGHNRPAVPDDLSLAESPVHVRSSEGYRFERIWVAQVGGEWTEVALDARGFAESSLSFPLNLKAAGHNEVSIDRRTDEITLRPQFSLQIYGPDLESRVRNFQIDSVHLGERYALGDALLWQRLESDRFGLAVHWLRNGKLIRPPLILEIEDLAGRLHRFEPKEGADGFYECVPSLFESRAVELQIVAECALRDGCFLGPNGTITKTAWVLPPVPRAHSDIRQFDWGIYYHRRNRTASRVVSSGKTVLAAGIEFGASALCSSCGFYGREIGVVSEQDFAVNIPMLAGAIVRGRGDRELWDSIEVRWRFEQGLSANEQAKMALWNGEDRLSLDDEGVFQLRFPRRVPPTRFFVWPMPSSVKLRFSVSGCSSLERFVELQLGGVVDLGALQLECTEPSLAFSPGHGLDPSEVKSLYVARSRGTRDGELSTAGARLRRDGTLEVFLAKPEFLSHEFDLGTPERVLVRAGGVTPVGFRLVGDQYVRVQESVAIVDLLVASEAIDEFSEVTLGWTWWGIEYPVRVPKISSITNDPHWSFPHPQGVDLVWWSDSRFAPKPASPGRSALLRPDKTELRIP